MENFNWKTKKVLVTGAGGFIGSHLTEHLVELGAEVRALVQYNSLGSWEWLEDSYVKNDIEVILGDIRDQDCVQRIIKDGDIVFHLAALIGIPYSYEAPSSYVQTNIMGTLNVLQAGLKAGVERIIHTSTSETYGSAQYIPIDEKHPLCGQSPYAASKIGADMLAESFYRSFDLPLVTIRPFNTYGPRQSARAIIPTIITQLLSKNDINIGSLSPMRDFTFVHDTVLGFAAAASSQENVLGEVFNLGSGKQISIGELVQFIMKLTGSSVHVLPQKERVRPEKSEVVQLQANTTKVQKILGWSPKTSLEEGLLSTLEWFKQPQYLNKYKRDLYHL